MKQFDHYLKLWKDAKEKEWRQTPLPLFQNKEGAFLPELLENHLQAVIRFSKQLFDCLMKKNISNPVCEFFSHDNGNLHMIIRGNNGLFFLRGIPAHGEIELSLRPCTVTKQNVLLQ